ncbi:citrate transporter [Trypanosoma rangeli]|uniref:Citrate transporter n=1 Tax=Trypanosoma rangeli TaxID=5698 RepID=A0A3R7MRA0_TRYRA|nr:citrate transporter [Trypanosoma rangeli]RNF09976.1 citrate transporter [Trypanosoma rangeli]|eukprot:RNF09976.1 citrate transporter [Trypanosoma rangeli]
MSVVTEDVVTVPLIPISTLHLPKGNELLTRNVDNCYAALWSFLAGALTGGIEAIVTYPLEYVKTHLQLQQLLHAPSSSSLPHMYNGIWDCVKRTVQQHSPLGLYRGFVPVLLGSIPKQASRWGAYEWATDTAKTLVNGGGGVRGEEPTVSLPVLSLCGFFAGCVETACAVSPTESVKTRMIHDSRQAFPRYQSLGTCRAVLLMVRECGFRRTFYSGVSATMLKQGLNQALRFPAQKFVMDTFCCEAFVAMWHPIEVTHGESGGGAAAVGVETMRQLQKARQKSPLWNGLAGFVAGVFSVLVTQPVDVVKTQMQSGVVHRAASCNSSGTSLSGSESPHIRGLRRSFHDIYCRRGIAGFYAGTIARSIHVGTHVALVFTVFPLIRRAVVGTAGHKKE